MSTDIAKLGPETQHWGEEREVEEQKNEGQDNKVTDGTRQLDDPGWSRTINPTYSSDYTEKARPASAVRRTEVGAG